MSLSKILVNNTEVIGVDIYPTSRSKNLVESDGVKTEIEKNIFQDLKQSSKIFNIESTFNINENDDTFYITDLSGNVVAKINSNGIQVIKYIDKDGRDIVSKILNIEEFINILKKNNDAFYITDSNGNIIIKADEQGLHAINFLSKGGVNIIETIESLKSVIGDIFNIYENAFYITDLSGNIVVKIDKFGIHDVKYANYELFSIGDSLSTPGIWQSKTASILECKFDNAKNNKPGMNLSTGGTMMAHGSLTSGFYRAKNLVDQNVISGAGENAIIILENINDASLNLSGSITDKVMIPQTPIEGDFDLTNASITSQQLATIPSAERKLDACINCYKVTNNGKRLTITGLPSQNGNVSLYVGNNGVSHQRYDITVSTEDSYADIVAKILEYYYTGVMDIDGGDGKSVIFGDAGTSLYVSFTDTGNTGMTCTITDNVSARMSHPIYFSGTSLSEWEDTTKWHNGDYITTYRAWKSIIQYLISNFPKAHIIVAAFPMHSTNPETYLDDDGSLDYNTWYNTDREIRGRELGAFLKEISNFYSIPYIDVSGTCGINLVNYLTYQNVNDVHPKTLGYQKIGETIAKYLQTIL